MLEFCDCFLRRHLDLGPPILDIIFVLLCLFFYFIYALLHLFFHLLYTLVGRNSYLGIAIVDLFVKLGFVRFAFVEELITTLADGIVDYRVDNLRFKAAVDHGFDVSLEAALKHIDLARANFFRPG